MSDQNNSIGGDTPGSDTPGDAGHDTPGGDTAPDSYQKPFKTPPMWLIPWISKAHVAFYKLTSGKIGSDLAGKPGLLLRTVGRRSGKTHTVCLPYLPDGDSKVVVASFAGADHHPAWFHNLRANPEVVVRDKGEVYWATATVPEGEERAQLWDKVVADAPWYGEYQVKTDRQIPVVRLDYARPYSD